MSFALNIVCHLPKSLFTLHQSLLGLDSGRILFGIKNGASYLGSDSFGN